MALNNPYAQYNNSKILTAGPGELVLMLYDGTIKFCNVAILSIRKGDLSRAHENIMKAERIIDHLLATLDRKYPVAAEFDKLYRHILDALVEVNISKDAERLEEVVEHIRLVRDNWKEVMKAAETKV